LTVQASSTTFSGRRFLLAILAIMGLVISLSLTAAPSSVRAGLSSPCPAEGELPDNPACLNPAQRGTDSSEDAGDFLCPEEDADLAGPGEVVWHFILNGVSPGIDEDSDDFPLVINAEFADDGVLTDEGAPVGGGQTHHFYVTTSGDDTLLDAWVELPEGTVYVNLVLSHICLGDEESTPTPTPEGSQLGGTGTPTASVPDTSMGSSLGGPLATLVFGAVLLASLGALAYANVKSARNRA
jgi:hypothetical protein